MTEAIHHELPPKSFIFEECDEEMGAPGDINWFEGCSFGFTRNDNRFQLIGHTSGPNFTRKQAIMLRNWLDKEIKASKGIRTGE